MCHHARVRRHPARNGLLAALTAGLLALTVAVLADLGSITAGAQPTDQSASASVGSSPSGQPMGRSFLSMSFEYTSLSQYTGRNPRAVNPVLVRLVRNLAPGQSPLVRIGGNSADTTWWPTRGEVAPVGANYALTEGWLRSTKAFAAAVGAHMIMGVNLAGGRPSVAATEARALLRGIGPRYIQALEIGNEPDVYGQFPWFKSRGRIYYSRAHNYSLDEFIAQFSQWRSALGGKTPVAGPAFAELTWLSGLGSFINAEPGLNVLTVHRYPLRACLTDPSAPGYPTIPSLLSDQASAGVGQAVGPYVGTAHGSGLAFRVDEMNSASCSGKWGVSNTFASALWVLDTLFNLQSVGVDGVNIHTLPGAAYELFSFKHPKRGWEAFVHPEYYGMLMFTQAFPPGAQLLPVNVSPSGPLKVWATRAPDGKTRVVLINKDPSSAYTVRLQISGMTGAAQLERLQAPSASSKSGMTLGGQSFGAETTTGTLQGSPKTEPVIPVLGNYTVSLPAASAAMLSSSNGSGGVGGPS